MDATQESPQTLIDRLRALPTNATWDDIITLSSEIGGSILTHGDAILSQVLEIVLDRDEKALVRDAALHVLFRAGKASRQQGALAVLQAEPPSPTSLLRQAVKVVAEMEDPAHEHILMKFADHETWDIRFPARVALLKLGNEQWVLRMKDTLAASRDDEEVGEAIGAIMHSGSQKFLREALDALSENPTSPHRWFFTAVVARAKGECFRPIQAVGPPDTPPGNPPNASVWRIGIGVWELELTYAQPMAAKSLTLVLMCGHKAIKEIHGRLGRSQWQPLWLDAGSRIIGPRFTPELQTHPKIDQIKILVDQARASGPVEIDAVSINDGSEVQWAAAAQARALRGVPDWKPVSLPQTR